MNTNKNGKRILVTGATGYVGGRLVSWLLDKNYTVRTMSRNATRLHGRSWSDKVEIVEGDVLDEKSLDPVFESVDIAYYLIHSMEGGQKGDFAKRDIFAADNFAKAAEKNGVKRIIYLGGLGSKSDHLSKHLQSRQNTGHQLRKHTVPVTEFRAAVVVGSGSISFEMIRNLTNRLPVMICPKWVYSKVQPIAIRNILEYLVAAIENPETADKIIEIGGETVLTYAEMIQGYAKANNLKRLLIPVPFLTPKLSSYWVHHVTPISKYLARPLIEGLKNDVVVEDESAKTYFPEIKPFSYKKAVELALNRMNDEHRVIETTWNDALISSRGDRKPIDLKTEEGLLIERRVKELDIPPEKVFNVYCQLGGTKGWPSYNWAWKLRGSMDRVVGGVGFRRGRRDPKNLRVGDVLDFWRVEAIKQNHLLRLHAEMKLPGTAWLEFQSNTLPDGRTKFVQTAYFDPSGLSGLLYWYSLYPFHQFIFSSMINRLAREAGEK